MEKLTLLSTELAPWIKNFWVWISITFVVLILTLIVIIEHITYEYIDCKVTENGLSRNTTVKRHRRKNTYKLHARSGKWIPLDEKYVEIIKRVREKFALRIKHGKHIRIEFTIN